MPERIIAAVDDREQSSDAIGFAADLAAGIGADLDVASVLGYDPIPIDIEPYEEALREHFDRIFERVDEQKPGLAYTARRITGSSPPRALGDLSEELEAMLVVVGSTHRGSVGRVLPGSVAERMLSGGPCPVAVAPVGYAGSAHRIERIGVGFDGREESRTALSFAAGLAARAGARLHLIAVLPPPSSMLEALAGPLGYEDLLREQLTTALEQASASVEGVETETSLLAGDPAAKLAERSAALDALVVGSRGYGPIRRVLLGDVGSALTRKADCPIIVVPRCWEVGTAEPAPE